MNINNIIYVTDSLLYWAEPLACLSLLSIMSWIRPDTRIWKLALSQPCSPRIKEGRKRVKCLLRLLLKNEVVYNIYLACVEREGKESSERSAVQHRHLFFRMDVPILNMCLRPILIVTAM